MPRLRKEIRACQHADMIFILDEKSGILHFWSVEKNQSAQSVESGLANYRKVLIFYLKWWESNFRDHYFEQNAEMHPATVLSKY